MKYHDIASNFITASKICASSTVFFPRIHTETELAHTEMSTPSETAINFHKFSFLLTFPVIFRSHKSMNISFWQEIFTLLKFYGKF